MGKPISWIERFSRQATAWAGSTAAFSIAVGIILVWIVTGPIFGFSDTWQLVINTGTTVVTFLMVFLIQRSQNKDAEATQLKLNALVAAVKGASNRLIDAEDLAEEELRELHRHYQKMADKVKHRLNKSPKQVDTPPSEQNLSQNPETGTIAAPTVQN